MIIMHRIQGLLLVVKDNGDDLFVTSTLRCRENQVPVIGRIRWTGGFNKSYPVNPVYLAKILHILR